MAYNPILLLIHSKSDPKAETSECVGMFMHIDGMNSWTGLPHFVRWTAILEIGRVITHYMATNKSNALECQLQNVYWW